MRHVFKVLTVGLILVLLMLARPTQQASKMRWDIVTFTSWTPPTFKEGGPTFAAATDAGSPTAHASRE